MKMIKIDAQGVYPVEVNGLHEMQNEVGGYIEIVNLSDKELRGSLMIVNEEGMIQRLAVNPIASLLYGFETHGQIIVGDVLIAKYGESGIVGFGDSELEEMLAKIDAFVEDY